MRVLQISLQTHLFELRHSFATLLLLVIILLINGRELPLSAPLLGLFFLLLFAVPLSIHVQYYRRQRHVCVLLYPDRLEIAQANEAAVVIPYGAVEELELHAAGGIYRKIEWENFAFQSYHYVKIVHQSKAYYLTSLLVNEPLERVLDALIATNQPKYKRIKRIMADIS